MERLVLAKFLPLLGDLPPNGPNWIRDWHVKLRMALVICLWVDCPPSMQWNLGKKFLLQGRVCRLARLERPIRRSNDDTDFIRVAHADRLLFHGFLILVNRVFVAQVLSWLRICRKFYRYFLYRLFWLREATDLHLFQFCRLRYLLQRLDHLLKVLV